MYQDKLNRGGLVRVVAPSAARAYDEPALDYLTVHTIQKVYVNGSVGVFVNGDIAVLLHNEFEVVQ